MCIHLWSFLIYLYVDCSYLLCFYFFFFFFQAEDGIRDWSVTGVQTCALPICGTMKAIWDNIRGLDLLETLPYVKKGKVGAIGHSLGGHNAIYTAVFDDRIKIGRASCRERV